VTYVKVGKLKANLLNLDEATSGVLDRLTIRAEKLSPAVIGGVVCNLSGKTVGIVEAVEGSDARVLGAETIRTAAKRVLEQRASVPRPWLGVRGEPVELAAQAAFLSRGWQEAQWKDLVKGRSGILLTSVVPRTPAAQAKLRPGDVILRVNEFEVKTAEEFSKLLGDAGTGVPVEFTVRRPDATAPFSVPVTLGRSFGPMFDWHFEMQRMTPFFTLQTLGVETGELTPKAAAALGAQRGVIVVAVLPDSAAARGGVREGDVIESFDGRLPERGTWVTQTPGAQKKHTLWIVRGGEKKKIVVDLEE
jgi:S1-C subfamily serine protease